MAKTTVRRKFQPLDNEGLAILLEMCCVEVHEATVASWTDEQRTLAHNWAASYYLRASDNIVRVPPKPDFLPEQVP